MRYDSVIFDLDGTLLDTLGDLASGVNHMREVCGLEPLSEDLVKGNIGYGVANLIKWSFPEYTDEDKINEITDGFKAYYSEHMTEKTHVYDGIFDILDELDRRDIKYAVVTNKFHAAAKKIVEQYFGDRISCVIGDGNGYAKKPAPDAVWAAIEMLGRKKEDSIYVGDSEADVKTARNSLLPCLCVTWGLRSKEMLLEHSPDFIIDSPEEFFSVLDK